MHVKKILLISEALCAPFDEGFKNVVFSLCKQLESKENVMIVTKAENKTDDLKVTKVVLNKFLLNKNLKSILTTYSPDIVLYIPFASYSLGSFLRAKILKLMSKNSKVLMLGIQHRALSPVIRALIANFLSPDLLLLLKKTPQGFFNEEKLKMKILPPAVDSDKFRPVIKKEKDAIRAAYNIPDNKKIVLHVGHIKASRNIESLIEVQGLHNIQVVVVGSSSMGVDNNIKKKLEEKGVVVLDGYVNDVSRLYKMADLYVFPVLYDTAAIDMPLSVLEAMACNLPVITTRFGGLVNFFKEDPGLMYFETTEELIALIKNLNNMEEYNNRRKIEPFTWGRFSDEIMATCEEVV
ncbi:MAG: glycosyltransferase family 4 protein [Nitrospirae bacterium]|nr:glycosyltransferase family 4 protein [Nitrospirota bacterium]